MSTQPMSVEQQIQDFKTWGLSRFALISFEDLIAAVRDERDAEWEKKMSETVTYLHAIFEELQKNWSD